MHGVYYILSTDIQCGGTTSLKRPILVSPTVQNYVCTYTIRPSSSKVCQVRFDFEVFSLANPTLAQFYQCTVDSFNVRDIVLCGQNSGQHGNNLSFIIFIFYYYKNLNRSIVYVLQNITQANQPLTVSITTASRTTNPGLITPSWRIQVTQLDCPHGYSLRTSLDDSTSREFTDFIIPETRSSSHDGFWLAPYNCLQYFPEPTGLIESFNLNNGAGPYIGDMRYSICFRRTSGTTGVRLTASIFQIAYTGDLQSADEGVSEACYSEVETPVRSEDHLFLPSARVVINQLPIRAARYCAVSLLNVPVDINPPGPLSIFFNSDQLVNPTIPEIGFRFSYTLY